MNRSTLNLHRDITEILDTFPEIYLAIVFGSAVNEKYFREDSDIDIAIAGEKIFDSESLMHLNMRLTEKLRREIDLIDLNRVSGVILSRVLTCGKLIFNKRPALYAEIIKKMWYNQSDMMPNYRMILKARIDKRNIRTACQ